MAVAPGFLVCKLGIPCKAWNLVFVCGMWEIWISDPLLNEAVTRLKPQLVALLVIILSKGSDCSILPFSQKCCRSSFILIWDENC